MQLPDTSNTFNTRNKPPQPKPRAALMRALWVLPLILSLGFVGVVMALLERSDAFDRESLQQTMIADALSLEAQLRTRLESENEQLQLLLPDIISAKISPSNFSATPQFNAGLQRFWQSITWLDAQNQVLVHLPPQSMPPALNAKSADDARGLSAHIRVPISLDKTKITALTQNLIVRYSPRALLQQQTPWWLARKYEVRLLDSNDQEIATTYDSLKDNDSPKKPYNRASSGIIKASKNRPSYRLSFETAIPDAFLELTVRQPLLPWYQALPLILMAGFLLLIAIATWMLRRQMLEVARAERAWRTEAAWRSAMEDSVVVGLRARDLDGRMVYVNRTLEEMVGWSAAELVGKLPPMPYWPPNEMEETMQRHLRNMAGGAPREGYQANWRHRDGRNLVVMIFETPLVDASGKQIGWMGSILDVTERRQLEEREAQRIQTMQYHARLTMLGEVASTLAHELNQPLMAISSYNTGVINTLKRNGFDDAVVLGALERLGQQSANAGRIVQRIRAFLTRRTPQREHVNLSEVIAAAEALLKREMQDKKINLSIEAAANLPALNIDAVLIEQVIINLLRNAADAFSEAHTDKKIALEVSVAAPQWVRVTVSDNGPGLNGRTLEQLAAPFYSTKAEGMGMGLAICRSIIEAHGGAFEAAEVIKSFAKTGAKFSFSLPIAGLNDSAEEN